MKLMRPIAGILLALLILQYALYVGLLVVSRIVAARDNDLALYVFILLQGLMIAISLVTFYGSTLIIQENQAKWETVSKCYKGMSKAYWSEFWAIHAPYVPRWLGPLSMISVIVFLLGHLIVKIAGVALLMQGHIEELDRGPASIFILTLSWGLFSLPLLLSKWRETSQPQPVAPHA
jgi:hypothetical protein